MEEMNKNQTDLNEDTLSKLNKIAKEYEMLLKEKSRLYEETEANKKDIKDKADELCEAISDAGLKNLVYDGHSYTPGVTTKYYLMGEGDALEQGLDRFAPFENDAALCGLVKKTIGWQSLQKPLQQMAESEEGIPEDVLEVITSKDEFGISRRKASTKNMEKVANALERRKKNV